MHYHPPLGIIDGSVLTAVGLLLLFGVVAQIPTIIKAGRSVKVTKGDFEVELSQENQSE